MEAAAVAVVSVVAGGSGYPSSSSRTFVWQTEVSLRFKRV